MIPIAIYKASSEGTLGIRPLRTFPISGWAKIISKINEKPMMATKASIKASIFRMPLLIKNNNKNVSKTVIKTPCNNGIPNNKFRPIAIPNTSARSQDAMAISAKKYKI